MNNVVTDAFLSGILQRLNFLARAKKNEKPCFDGFNSRYQPNTFFQRIVRTFSSHSRQEIYSFLHDLSADCSISIEIYRESPHYNYLIQSMKDSRNGVENLKLTYSEDINLINKLNIYLAEINAMLENK